MAMDPLTINGTCRGRGGRLGGERAEKYQYFRRKTRNFRHPPLNLHQFLSSSMSLLLRRPKLKVPVCSLLRRQCISKDSRAFAEGDLVLLRQTQDRSAPPILSRPLKSGRRIDSHRGVIQHDDIISKRVRDVVQAKTKSERAPVDYRIHDVTLEEYVRLTRRLVTPIYPADASLIVQLLDLHPDPWPSDQGGGKIDALEILEAGTGHGSLTLYLSRAIHAANANSLVTGSKDDRRAIIHTIDVNGKFSAHAKEIVEGFRHGIYAHNIDFHVGNVSDWIKNARLNRRPGPFLSHAFLDLPSADTHLQAVAESLKTDASLIVFNPSITQINECAIKTKSDKIELELERVVELGVNGGSGGREWDVRFVRPRALQKPEAEADSHISEGDDSAGSEVGEANSCDTPAPDSRAIADKSLSMVCRPKVGERITGGGFLGIFKKRRETRDDPQ